MVLPTRAQLREEMEKQCRIDALVDLPRTKIVKRPESVIIPSRRETLLKHIGDMESELGRMTKLLAEVRADVLHLTTE
jgi:hypothetical protein